MTTSEGFETRLGRFTSLGTMISCIIYGVHVAVLLVTREYLIRTSMLSTPRNRLWWTLSMLLFVCVTVSLALQVCWSMGVERILEGSGSGLNVARVLLFMTINWVSDSILLFRFFAVPRTGRRFTVMILPLAMIMSSIGISSTYHREIAAAYTSSWSDASNTPTIIYLTLSCALDVYLAAHILFWTVRADGASITRIIFRRIATMFIQSTLFCLIPTLVFVILCAQRSLAQNLLFPIVCQFQSLSPLLVIMRVARHRHLHRDSEMVTADKFLSVPVPGPFCHQTGLQTRSSKQIRMTDSRCLYYCQPPDTAPA